MQNNEKIISQEVKDSQASADVPQASHPPPNQKQEDYSCYYCDYKTNDMGKYENHVVIIHGRPSYPNKAEIEKYGLKSQGKEWEK